MKLSNATRRIDKFAKDQSLIPTPVNLFRGLVCLIFWDKSDRKSVWFDYYEERDQR